jgi:outer membrane receptor for ferrienterochelin and colicin
VFFGSEDRIRVINAGVFVQSVFDVANRYFLTLGMRVDGNSAFGEGLGLQSYPKVSGSYVISDEAWWWKNLGTMKLRGAWGQSGRAPGAFDAVRTWSTYSWGGSSTFLPRNLGNSQLGPERTSETELGFDAAAPGARLQVGFTWYRRDTRDALFAVRTRRPLVVGKPAGHVGKLQSHGIELT